MVVLTNSDLRALFVQYQQHRNCEKVHIYRGIFGRLNFHFEERRNSEAAAKLREAEREAKIAEEKLALARRKAKSHK